MENKYKQRVFKKKSQNPPENPTITNNQNYN